MKLQNRKVVITGVGVVSSIGNDYETFKSNLKKGISGVGPITQFDTTSFPVKKAFEVRNFDARSFGVKLMDPFIQYAVGATAEALERALFDTSSVDPFRVGLAVSSSKGGMHTIDRFKERFKKNPSAILGARIYTNSIPNFAAQWIARKWKLKGPAKCYIAACATGTVAISEGARMVREGIVDYCIAGASDASVVPLMLAGYHQMKALSRTSMRPFDKHRDGFRVGEGAGIVFLETEESARARGAKIFAKVLSSAAGQDAYHALKFNPDADTLSRVLKNLSESIANKDWDYINTHGTATGEGDKYETEQLKKALGPKLSRIALSSTKSMTGHMLGASGAVEVIASLAAMEESFIPPTVGLETADPECDLDFTAGKAKEKDVKTALSYSMGFGGHVAAIALGKTS